MRRPAVVFSPHFDDETLGCGGTIIKKKMAGADVKIVFMTDGSKSHRHLIAEDELKTIRTNEALAVSRLLGLQNGEVIFLGFEETKLNEYADSAAKKVTEVLFRTQPSEVFIPYHKEPLLWSEDHLSTNRIVVSALQMFGRKMVVYEYPIWFWHH
jgi:LmbE family N-acetylglucosaminyl deacetylase